MTTKQIQSLLLTHYLFVREAVRGMWYEHIHEFLHSVHTQWGICQVAGIGYGHNIMNARWVKRNLHPGTLFWGDTPLDCYSNKDIMSALSLRIAILQKELGE